MWVHYQSNLECEVNLIVTSMQKITAAPIQGYHDTCTRAVKYRNSISVRPLLKTLHLDQHNLNLKNCRALGTHGNGGMVSYVVVLGAMPTSQRTAPSLASRFLRMQAPCPPSIPEAAKRIHTPPVVDAWAYIASVPSLLLQ